ncbi:MAG: hypothetical protein ACOC93_02235 [Planctomycetota bacterium]
MKKALIVALVCINVGLLATLMLETTLPEAKGQVRAADYQMITAAVGSDYDAVFILDLGTRRLAALAMDKGRGRLQPYEGRRLVNDFGRNR